MEVMPRNGAPVSDLVLDVLELLQPFLSSSLGFPVLHYWWSAVHHADVFPLLFHGYFSSGFLVEGMERSTHGNICLNNFSKQTADGIAASFWSYRKKNPMPVVLV